MPQPPATRGHSERSDQFAQLFISFYPVAWCHQ